eukprot:CAMPEP_0185783096 /NCGR_PEP_ID=MMETSP1174-20130828/114275_1 /TAXON_ID=35687 /ORGANISM="Dictyocha speculum, Strain CCMP1381" /LENGTH=146 /DNA_ID=CAMNT_0028473951 /DNA_START=64 /DNA_END=504 /DNA_ORIENTATION=-
MNVQAMEKDVEEYFDKADADGYGTLHEDEFRALIAILRLNFLPDKDTDGTEASVAVTKERDEIEVTTAKESHNRPSLYTSLNEMEPITDSILANSKNHVRELSSECQELVLRIKNHVRELDQQEQKQPITPPKQPTSMCEVDRREQ